MKGCQNYDTILKRVYELIVPFVEKGTALREDLDFVTDLSFDSLKVMKLVEQVEDEYDISIPLNILPDVQTIKDFVIQLQRLVAS